LNSIFAHERIDYKIVSSRGLSLELARRNLTTPALKNEQTERRFVFTSYHERRQRPAPRAGANKGGKRALPEFSAHDKRRTPNAKEGFVSRPATNGGLGSVKA